MANRTEAKKLLKEYRQHACKCADECMTKPENQEELISQATQPNGSVDPQELLIKARDKCEKSCITAGSDGVGVRDVLNKALAREGNASVVDLDTRPNIIQRFKKNILARFNLQETTKPRDAEREFADKIRSAKDAEKTASRELEQAKLSQREASMAVAATILEAAAAGAIKGGVAGLRTGDSDLALSEEQKRMIERLLTTTTGGTAELMREIRKCQQMSGQAKKDCIDRLNDRGYDTSGIGSEARSGKASLDSEPEDKPPGADIPRGHDKVDEDADEDDPRGETPFGSRPSNR